eukprot:COSAG04_NODE_20769_length_387_cov_0.534722_1_plen_90_part_00
MLQGEFDIDERPKTVQPQLAAAQYVELPSAQANVRSAQGVVQAAVTHEKTLRNFYRAKVRNAVFAPLIKVYNDLFTKTGSGRLKKWRFS